MRTSSVSVLLWVAALVSSTAFASNGRLLTVDAAEPLGGHVLGLQRSAVNFGSFAVDTAVIADAALLANLGVRWAMVFGQHRVVVGSRYAHFMGTAFYSAYVNQQESQVIRFEPQMSGPSVYGVYGYAVGPVLAQAELRWSNYGANLLSTTAAVALALGGGQAEASGVFLGWSIIAEVGYRLMAPTGTPGFRAAGGMRFAGDHFGFTLGAAYVGVNDPLFPSLPVLPVVDLSWTF